MKNLSMREFKDFCDKRALHDFIFTSENQDGDVMHHTVRVQLSFPIMLIAFNPNMICFRDNDNFLQFNGVKVIRMVRESSAIGTIFDVVCKSSFGEPDITYTLVAK